MASSSNELKGFGQRLDRLSAFSDPAIQQAIQTGLREQATAQTEQVTAAAGLTGASAVQANQQAVLAALAQGVNAARSREIQNRNAFLELRLKALSEAGRLDESRFEANLQANTQLRLQEMQNKAALKSALIGGIAGAAGGFLGGAFGAGGIFNRG